MRIMEPRCFFFGHDWKCLLRWRIYTDLENRNSLGSEVTAWKCFKCDETKTEQWDL